MATNVKNLQLPSYLFWDIDVAKMDIDQSYRLVIERVIQLGTLEQWRNTQRYFGKDRFLEVVDKSNNLSEREQSFTRLFIDSDFHAAF